MTCIGTGGLFTKPIAIILGACALFLAAPAIAGDQNFTLFNKTGNDIAEVYVSPASAKAWGDDVMEDEVLEDTASVPSPSTPRTPSATTTSKSSSPMATKPSGPI